MNLHVIGTGSGGNCYLFKPENGKALVVDIGITYSIFLQAINFNLDQIGFFLITHEHGDHSKGFKDIEKTGKTILCSKGTKEKLSPKGQNVIAVEPSKTYKKDGFSFTPFKVEHDAAEPFGFLIEHPEMGKTVFVTDAIAIPYKFDAIDHFVIEANYCEEIIEKKLGQGKKFLQDRVITNHMSFQTSLQFLKRTDLKSVKNIVFIHLSDSNSNEARFKETTIVEISTNPHIAFNGQVINLNKNPF